MRPLHLSLLFVALHLTIACAGRGRGGGGGGDDDDSAAGDDDDDTVGDDDDGGCSPEGALACVGADWSRCDDGLWVTEQVCTGDTPLCAPNVGCVSCLPGLRSCDGNTVLQCAPDGLSSSFVEECPADAPCVGGYCQDPCGMAEAQQSYFGCEFLAVSTTNQLSPSFDSDFAVVIANPPGQGAAEVEVRRGGSFITSASVADGATEAISLPMVGELSDASASVTVPGGAYEIETSVPVAAYQFNPLHFTSPLDWTYSHTNDASLLLPEHVLTGEYRVMAAPTFGVGVWDDPSYSSGQGWFGWGPGFLAVAATADGTVVSITLAGDTGAGSPGAAVAGTTIDVPLDRGGVVQLHSEMPAIIGSFDSSFCTDNGWVYADDVDCSGTGIGSCTYCLLPDSDLSGTTVSASAPVAVWSGHQCTFVPFDAWACDHLEEMMFPVETWGTTVVMSAVRHADSFSIARSQIRVLANHDATTVTFDPAVHPETVLDAGEVLEFESVDDFVVTADRPIYVGQLLLGQNALGASEGDPALGSGIPLNQWRRDYDFLTPDTYTTNFLNVVAEDGAVVLLDGAPLAGWQSIGATGFSAARVSVTPGSHHIESEEMARFGITTYGYALYTSYLYPGGLNFTR